MGRIKKIVETELVGGTQSVEVYPVTSTLAVYDTNNRVLDDLLKRNNVVNISTNYNDDDDNTVSILTLSQAAMKVNVSDRVLGFTGKFLSEDGWVICNYIGEDLSHWNNTDYWITFLNSSQLKQTTGDDKTAPISQHAVAVELGKICPFSVEQGDIQFKDFNRLYPSISHVRTKYFILGDFVKRIKTTKDDLYMFIYICDKSGKIIQYHQNETDITLSSENIYRIVFSYRDLKEITPQDVLDNTIITYNSIDDSLKEKHENDTLELNDIELKDLFILNKYLDTKVDKKYLPKYAKISNNFKTLTLPVKKGDSFLLNKLKCKDTAIDSFTMFDEEGYIYLTSDKNFYSEEYITVGIDGYIVFNSMVGTPLSIIAKKVHIPYDWAYSYLAGLFNNHLEDSSINRSIESTLDITPFFIKDSCYNLLENKEYRLGLNTANSKYNCLSIKVKRGNYFLVSNLKGGDENERAYAIYNKYGEQISIAEPSKVLNENITITEDGYIVFNALKESTYSIQGHFNIFDDWNWHYVLPIMENINSLLKDNESNKSSIKKIQGDLYEDYIYKKSDSWEEGYIEVAKSNVDIKTPVDFSPITLDKYYHLIIPCKQGDKFKLNVANGNEQSKGWVFLNSDKYIISSMEGSYFTDIEIEAPEDASYLIVQTEGTSSWIEYGNELVIHKIIEEKVGNIEKKINKEIKILCFGDSFTIDSMSSVPFILKNLIPDVNLTLGLAYLNNCPLVQHAANFLNDDYMLSDITYAPKDYIYCKNINGSPWEKLGKKDTDTILLDEKWDIITFQQSGDSAYLDWDTYFSKYINLIHEALFRKIKYNIRIGWLLTHGSHFDSDETALNHWEGTVMNSKKVMDITGTSVLFPYGTAVQNLRTTNLKNLGSGSAHNLTYNNIYLQSGLGYMVAAYTNVLVILKYLNMNHIGVIGESTRINLDFIVNNNIGILNTNLLTGEGATVIGITEPNCYYAQVAAECAIKNPYTLTDLNHIVK